MRFRASLVVPFLALTAGCASSPEDPGLNPGGADLAMSQGGAPDLRGGGAPDLASAPDLATGGGGGGDPFAGPTVCTSKINWFLGDVGTDLMHPGKDCNACHRMKGGKAPIFTIDGTVYPTGHEPDDCSGKNGIQVIITDANGKEMTLNTNFAGNFSSRTAVALPYKARVVAGGKTRAMAGAQSSGDCNSCHTEKGANGAPGRIVAP